MSVICEIALALGITFDGLCQPPQPVEVTLPDEDATAWEYQPPPPPPPPEPQKAPEFPAIVIKQDPPPKPEPIRFERDEPPPPAKVEPPPPPDPYRVALNSVFARRTLRSGGLAAVHVPAGASAEPIPVAPEPAEPNLDPPAVPPLPGSELPDDPLKTRYRTEGEYSAEGRISSLPVNNERIVAADRYITGILETGINSQIDGGDGGQVIIQTSRDVFGYHARKALVPKGSRLICDYESPEELGETRLAIECKRVLIAGHRAEILQLATGAGDVQGRLGVTGEVDTRFVEKYGTAFAIAGISAAVRLSSAFVGRDDPDSAVGAITDQGSQELSERLGEITAAVLEDTVDLEPIVTIPQGTRITLRPKYDWYITEIEEVSTKGESE